METTLKGERRIQRVRHELRRREVRVAQVEQISPGFARLTFVGDDLADFVSLSFDDHVKFMFVDPTGEVIRRDYTPLQHDAAARTLSIEFALHERGAASDCARAAQVGQPATIGGPRGSMIIPLDYDWHLLVGDSAALPAIHRRLRELPASARAIAVIQLDDAADRREFASAADVAVHWVRSGEELLGAVRALQLPAGSGFAWGAGEASLMRPLRELLRTEKGIASVDMRVAAYWKQGAADFHERLDD